MDDGYLYRCASCELTLVQYGRVVYEFDSGARHSCQPRRLWLVK